MSCESCGYCIFPTSDRVHYCKCRIMMFKPIDVYVGGGETPKWCPLKKDDEVAIMKSSTRAKSNQQEKRIAKAMGGRQVIGSGSTPFLKGDVVAGNLFIEAKTKMVPSSQITVKKEWIDKAKEQSLSMRKEDYAIAVSFGDDKDYYLIEDTFMEELYRSREALKVVINTIGELDHDPLGLESGEIYSIKELIKEVFKYGV